VAKKCTNDDGRNAHRLAIPSLGISGATRSSISLTTGVIRAGIWFSSRRVIAPLTTPTAVCSGGIDEWPPVRSRLRFQSTPFDDCDERDLPAHARHEARGYLVIEGAPAPDVAVRDNAGKGRLLPARFGACLDRDDVEMPHQ